MEVLNLHTILGMSFMNHVAGGIVFTGIFCSICGINILRNEWFIAWTVFSAAVSYTHLTLPTILLV